MTPEITKLSELFAKVNPRPGNEDHSVLVDDTGAVADVLLMLPAILKKLEAAERMVEAVRDMHSDLDDYAGSEGDERGMWEAQRDAILKSYEEETQ